MSKTLDSEEVDGSTVTGYVVSGSARNFASGVTTRSTASSRSTTFIATGTRRVCSPETSSTVESHITGAGITARFLFLPSVNRTLPSGCSFAVRPSAFSGRV